MSEPRDIQLGLCCMNITMKKDYKIYASRKMNENNTGKGID